MPSKGEEEKEEFEESEFFCFFSFSGFFLPSFFTSLSLLFSLSLTLRLVQLRDLEDVVQKVLGQVRERQVALRLEVEGGLRESGKREGEKRGKKVRVKSKTRRKKENLGE